MFKSYVNYLLSFVYKILKNTTRRENIKKLIANKRLTIGRNTYGYYNLKIYEYKGSLSKINIGNFTSIAPEVTIITGGIHPINTVTQFPIRAFFKMEGAYKDGNPYTKGDISIGSDVWIGTGVTILSGVSIGDGSIIYCNTLVNKSIPPFSIVGGIPCRIIGYRFSEQQRQELLELKWWEWTDEKVKYFVNELSSNDIESFILKQKKLN
jgi:acetyltransferase-like isoleucine patch superfamily enzyme